MKYMGSKNRIAKELISIMLANRANNQYYIEPFVGGANVIDKVNGLRIAADNNRFLIAMYNGVKNGEIYPEVIDKDLYNHARDMYNGRIAKTMSDDLVGWIGFMASANGRFFEGGYSGRSNTKIGTVRDYVAESIRGIRKQKDKIVDIEFNWCDYADLNIPESSIIYCDIPYQGTKQYSTSKEFNYLKFWNWCREKTRQGHQVYISEYNAPDDFICVWEKEVSSSLRANKVITGSKKATEKLFIYQGAK